MYYKKNTLESFIVKYEEIKIIVIDEIVKLFDWTNSLTSS